VSSSLKIVLTIIGCYLAIEFVRPVGKKDRILSICGKIMDSSQICFELICREVIVLLARVRDRFRDHCQRWRLSRIFVRINREQLDLAVTCSNSGLLLL